MSADRWIYYFTDAVPEGVDDVKALLGGKGASLNAMAAAGLHVPPGFTISTAACQRYFELGRRWPDGLEEEVRANLDRLAAETGRRFGQGDRPLLVSVRSGAAVSMPGMMDTLLNCGLHLALADEVGDTPHFWELYQQFIRMFARTVDGLDGEFFDEIDRRHSPEPTRALTVVYLHTYHARTGRAFPNEPWDVLVACINAVFESWNNQRAIAYRDHHGITGLDGTAVNVQMMFPSEVSGIVFTEDPNNLAARRMVIESSYGLGEAVVSGDVSPDQFLVDRDDHTKVVATIGQKTRVVTALGDTTERDPAAASLNAEELAELSTLALDVEKHFGHPVDMEWGLAEGRFALLQARPIRNLEIARETETARSEEIERLRAIADGPRHVWIAHNLGETLPAPTPLSWDIVRPFMTGSGGFGRMYRQFGYRPSKEVCDEGFLELIGGRIYADPDRLAELFWDGIPLRYELDALVEDNSLLDHGPSKFDPDKANGRFLVTLPGNLVAMWRSSRIMRRSRRTGRRLFEDNILPPYLQYVEQKRSEDLSKLSDEQVIAEIDARRRRVLDDFGPESLKPGFLGGLAFAGAESLLTQVLGPSKGPALATALTGALQGDTTFEQNAMLYEVAAGEATMEQFLDRFGHRCNGEMELAEPRWRESSSYLEQTVARLRNSPGRTPQEIHRSNLAQRRAAEEQLPETLAKWGGSALRERIEAELAEARELLPYRESGKHYLMMGYELIRTAIEELARRWDFGGNIYFLQLDELPRFVDRRSELEETAARRKLRWEALKRLAMPEVIDSNDLEALGRPQPIEAANQLEATAVAAGVATGPARIVLRPEEADGLGEGYILVCPSTDPGWTPLFLSAAGLIVERGGVLSHGAIVARDFGIPAVVCPNATRLLKPGEPVRVDGNHGRIVVIED